MAIISPLLSKCSILLHHEHLYNNGSPRFVIEGRII